MTKEHMKKIFILTCIIFIIIAALSVVRVYVSNQLSTTGMTLDRLQTEVMQYKKENIILRERVLAASSLTHIASEAAQLGFVPSGKDIYISAPLPLAYNQ